MRTRIIKYGLLLLFSGLVFGQTPSFAIQQHEKEWREYASFQRGELLSFCNFLYNEEHYDRALLGYFQFLFRFPGDSLEPAICFRIARCYQVTGATTLADDYFHRVRELAPPESELQRIAWHYILNNQMEAAHYDSVMLLTESSLDPVDQTFRGYIHFHRMEWAAARQAFKAAEAGFKDREYSRKFVPLYQAIESIGNVPRKKTGLTFISSLLPGGGYAYLGNRSSALATSVSVIVLSGLCAANWDEPRIALPLGMTGCAIYGISIWKTVNSVSSTNLTNLQKYVDYILLRYPVSRFVGLDEPEIF